MDCEIPQYLEVFTFHHSLRLLFISAISSFPSTFTTKLPVDTPCHVIMPSFSILSAPAYRTHSPHGPPFLPYFRTFCCVIIMKSRIICFQSLFLGATYQGLNPSFQISFSIHCQVLSQSIPSFSHILPIHSFLLPFILRLLYFIHFVLLRVHSL